MICCTLIAALGLCLAACGQEAKPAASGNTEEPYEVVIEWLSVGNTPSEENLQKVEAYINEQTLPAIGCTVRLYPVEMGELANTNALSVSTGEKIDLVVSVFTGVGDLVNQGLVLPIGDYVEQYGANIRNKLGDSINNGLYNGELYGITTAFIQAEAYGFVARADLLEAAHVEIDTDKIYTLDELSAVFDQVAQANPGLYMVAGLGSGSDTYVNFLGTTDVLGASSASGTLLLSEDKNSTEVVNIYATDEYASFAQTMYDWAQKKYIPADAAADTDDFLVQMKTGNYLGTFYWTTAGATDAITGQTGFEFTPISLSAPCKMTSKGVLWSVSATSKRPEKAFQLLDLLYGDNDLDTTLMYGLEGETFQVKEDNGTDRVVAFVDGLNAQTAPFYCYAGIYGDRLSWVIWEPADINYNQMLREFNEQVTEASPALGYSFTVSDNVSSEYAAVSAVISQYTPMISAGVVDPAEYLPKFIAALETAGINEVIAENQKQLDEFLSAK